MTASPSVKSVCRARRLCSGRGKARPDIRKPSQIVGQASKFDATRRSFINRFIVAHPVASSRSKSANSPAALKSP
jgi:hypothetical protein